MANTTHLNLVKPDYADDADIEDINENSEKIDAFAGNTIANIGGTDFSTSSTYAVGQIVKYNGKLYKCVTAVTTAGAWSASNWSEVSLQDEIDTVNVHNDRQNGTKLTTSSKYNVAGVEINNDTTPTSAKPNMGIDFRANDMRFYRDEGSGWVVKGDIPYNISNVETPTATPNTTNTATGSTFPFAVAGKVAVLNIAFSPKTALSANSNHVICTIPTGYRTSGDRWGVVFDRANGQVAYVESAANGNVTVRCNAQMPTSAIFRGQISWIIGN